MKSRQLVLSLLLLLTALSFPLLITAGGDSFPAQILELTPKGNDEYKMVINLQGRNPQQMILHLRYHPAALGKRLPQFITKERYLTCIGILKKQVGQKNKFQFGFLGAGYIAIVGKNDEYQCNALTMLVNYSGEKTIFSLAHPL